MKENLLVSVRQLKEFLDGKKKGVVRIILTPEIAEFLYGRNTNNRPITRSKVLEYSQALKEGFVHNGDTIKVSLSGKMIDGQHRCLAVIETGISMETVIVFGLPDEVFTTIDTGRSRTTADTFFIAEIENHTRMTTITKFIINFEKGFYEFAARGYSRGEKKISNAEALAFCQKNLKSIQESYGYGFTKDNKIISGTTLAGLHYIFKKKSPFHADIFCKGVADGVGLAKDSPVYVLRKKLIEDARQKRKMNIYEKVAIVCKAWSFFVKNRKITRLNFDTQKESFPKI